MLTPNAPMTQGLPAHQKGHPAERRGIPIISFATASPAKETGRDTSDKARAKTSGSSSQKDGKIQNIEEKLTHGTPRRRVTHWLRNLHEHVPTVPTIPEGTIPSDTP